MNNHGEWSDLGPPPHWLNINKKTEVLDVLLNGYHSRSKYQHLVQSLTIFLLSPFVTGFFFVCLFFLFPLHPYPYFSCRYRTNQLRVVSVFPRYPSLYSSILTFRVLKWIIIFVPKTVPSVVRVFNKTSQVRTLHPTWSSPFPSAVRSVLHYFCLIWSPLLPLFHSPFTWCVLLGFLNNWLILPFFSLSCSSVSLSF